MHIVLITRDRPELTRQTVESMIRNAADWSRHRLIMVYDGTESEFGSDSVMGEVMLRHPGGESGVFPVMTGSQRGVGGAKNFGAQMHWDWMSRDQESGRGLYDPNSLLMFSDNDMYYLPRWDERLEWALLAHPQVGQLGGWKHPFHQPRRSRVAAADGGAFHLGADGSTDRETITIHEVDAVTGNCLVIRWADWLRFGPFDANAIGPGQSEDFALSRRIVDSGGLVATLDPPVAVHCGIVNSAGEPAVGWEEMLDMAVRQSEQWPGENIGLVLPQGVDVSASWGGKWRGVMVQRVDGKPIIANKADESGKPELRVEIQRDTNLPHRPASLRGLNVGSGQRRFESTDEVEWRNLDSQVDPPDRIPDLVCDLGRKKLSKPDGHYQWVVLHQVLEHSGCGESSALLLECWRLLASGGSLIITVPDMRALAGRWFGGEIDTQLFMTNVYGAYMGEEADRHRWGFDRESLHTYLLELLFGQKYNTYGTYNKLKPFDWRPIPGADIARDWWILGMEVVKP